LPDGRPYFGGAGANELNVDPNNGGNGVYVIDNADEGYNYSITAQLRKTFDFGLSSFFSYTFLQAKSLMKSTEIASVLFAENPNKGDPNKPELSYSESDIDLLPVVLIDTNGQRAGRQVSVFSSK
jgi:hypothetical protein